MEKAEGKRLTAIDNAAVRWLREATRGKARYVAGLTAVQVALSLAGVVYSLLFRELVDHAVAGEGAGFAAAFGVVAAVTLLRLALTALNRWLDESTRSGVENALKQRLFATLLRKDHAAVTAVHSAEWMNRLTSDTVVVANGVAQIIPRVVGMAVKIVGALAAVIILQPLFGLMVLPAGLALLLITRVFRPALKRLHTRIQESDGALRVFLQERLDNLLIVTTFSREERSEELARERMDDHRRTRLRRNRVLMLSHFGFGLAIHGMYLLGAGICGWGIIQGTVTFGTLTAVLQLIGQLQDPFAGFSGYLSQWYSMTASAERLMEAERFEADWEKPAQTDGECLALYHGSFRGLRAKKLCFTYDDPQNGKTAAIRDLDLDLAKGEFVSLVGHSGCGKSTLLKLLLCLYAPDSGDLEILTDGAETPLTAAYRGLFAYVPQGNQLMSGTIRQVVAFDDEDKMTQDRLLWDALQVACAREFVEQLPQGLDTPLGEHGSGLSEGQIQRLAVARAICSQRPILLLDEATSALDEVTEAQLLENLRTMTDRTVLIITHRPRACEICDRVIGMEPNAEETGGGDRG